MIRFEAIATAFSYLVCQLTGGLLVRVFWYLRLSGSAVWCLYFEGINGFVLVARRVCAPCHEFI